MELAQLVVGLSEHGDDFEKIAEDIGTKSASFISDFYEKYKEVYGLDEIVGYVLTFCFYVRCVVGYSLWTQLMDVMLFITGRKVRLRRQRHPIKSKNLIQRHQGNVVAGNGLNSDNC